MQHSTEQLDQIRDGFNRQSAACSHRIIICAGTGCVANGSLQVYERFAAALKQHGLNAVVELSPENAGVHVSKSGCQGFCQMGPLVTILPDQILYTKVTPEDVDEIVSETLIRNQPVDRLLYADPADGRRCRTPEDIAFYAHQQRFVIKDCGRIDPEDIREYIAAGGYGAARRAVCNMTPEEICAEILTSGLRGRGGGGYPTGIKWDLARKQPGDKKYVICNGDEGDPGAFMDRSIMEGNPHCLIEAMIIAGRAIGADEGIVYVRAEYPLAVDRMRKAVRDAEATGVCGKNIFSSGSAFKLTVMEGAGAFVCGEETAMIASIQGMRGMPSPKPPYPVQSGLWGKPTVINNVETLATVPHIINMGADGFKKIGTPTSPGTKTFAVTGHVANTGLIEVPFGTTLRTVVFDIAGGVTGPDRRIDNTAFKAVQIGGPSGGCLTEKDLDLPLDFESLKNAGAMVGSGGLVVMNRSTCMVSVARFFMRFTQNESCGKCVPCREGTRQMLDLLDDIAEARATEETLSLLEALAIVVQKGSLCGLGKTAPSPVLSTLANFRQEYIAHVRDRKCPAGVCKALTDYVIDPELCKGCTLCAKKCPVGAISGEKKTPHSIRTELCIKCGACVETCKFKAITGAAA